MKRIALTLIAILTMASPLFSQDTIVSIPNAAFLHALIDEGVDTNEDIQNHLVDYEDEIFGRETGDYLHEESHTQNPNAIKKAVANDEYQLDSVLRIEWDESIVGWIPSEIRSSFSGLRYPREIYTYDAQGNLLSWVKYDWDTTASDWVIKRKVEYTYDANWNQLSDVSYDWDTTASDWVEWGTNEFTYDAQGNLLSSVIFDWANPASDGIGSWKREYTYDAQGNLLSDVSYDWDTTASDWVVSGESEFTYDAQGKRLSEVYYNWDAIASEWVRGKNEYTHDAQGNRLSSVYYDWDTTASDWVVNYKYESTYDTQGNGLSSVSYYWDATASNWVGSYKYESTYDAQGNLLLVVGYDWDATASDWVVRWKSENTYDAQGNQLSNVYYYWDATASDCVRSIKYEDTYDAQGNRLSSVQYDWDTTASDWAEEFKIQFSYSKTESSIVFNISPTSLFLGAEANSTATINITSNLDWSISGLESWLSASISSGSGNASIIITSEENTSIEPRTAYIIISGTDVSDRYLTVTQSDVTIGILNMNYCELDIYPNPTNSLLTIETDQFDHYSIEITSLNGQLILRRKIEGITHQIDLSSLQKGIYLITIRSKDFVTTQKIIKL